MTTWDVISNLAYILPIWRAFYLHAVSEGVLLLMVMLVSLWWHICNAWHFCFWLPFNFVQRLDTLTAELIFIIIVAYLLALANYKVKAVIYLLGFLLVYSVHDLDGTSVTAFIIIGVFLAIVVILRLIFGRKTLKHDYLGLDLIDLALTGIFVLGGLLLFVFANEEPAVHGIWHVCTALSAYFALDSLDRRWSFFCIKRKNPAQSPPEINAWENEVFMQKTGLTNHYIKPT